MPFADSDYPVIVETRYSMDPTTGTVLDMECEVRGDPMPVVVWAKDNTTLSSSDRVSVTISDLQVARLRIMSADVGDSGNYTCTLVNIAGSVSRSFQITVVNGDPDNDSSSSKFVNSL